MSHSFHSETLTYGLARSGDGDSRETYHITAHNSVLFLTRKCGVPVGTHKSFHFAVWTEYSLYSIELEGMMADKDHTRSE